MAIHIPLGHRIGRTFDYNGNPSVEFMALIDAWYRGETVWAEYQSGARKGSIGKLVPQGVEPGSTVGLPVRPTAHVPAYSARYTYYDLTRTELKFENGKADITMYGFEDIRIIPNYQGDVVWKFVRGTGKPPVPAKDQLGLDIEIGDLVMFGYKVYNTKGITQLLGRVTAISRAGVLTVKRMKLKETDHESEYKVPTPHGAIKLHDDIFKELMIRKLSFS